MKYLRALALLFVAGWALPPAGSQAQTYPSRPVTLVVPFAAGGATDAIARILNDSMTQSLGQQVVVETVGGAGGMIGAARVARAAPDGYTILLHQVGLAAGMTLYPNPSFDAEKDLTGIGLVNTSSSVIAGRKALPPNNMAELVQWMKQPGQNTKVAHAGVGAFGHLCGVLFVQDIGATADQIPYRGGGPALNDLVAGHADLSCLSSAVIEPQALPERIAGTRERGPQVGGPFTLEEIERAHITAIVAQSKTMDDAAAVLGIDDSTLWRKRKRYE